MHNSSQDSLFGRGLSGNLVSLEGRPYMFRWKILGRSESRIPIVVESPPRERVLAGQAIEGNASNR